MRTCVPQNGGWNILNLSYVMLCLHQKLRFIKVVDIDDEDSYAHHAYGALALAVRRPQQS